jgi:NAD(P)-dependent dehydrogenase (short-subunit alcohol dehydrogenase family)
VRDLAARGFTVVQGARDPAAVSRVDGDVLVRQLDVTDAASVERLAGEVDRVDVLVNNAAILYDTSNRATSVDLDVVRAAMETNLFGARAMSQALLPALRRSGAGRIVNVSSGAGSLATMGGGTPAYQVSKAALNAFTRTLAGELRGDGILVNAVCPGWVATDMGGRGGRPVEDGAASVVWAALLPDGGPTGGFFRDGEPVPW